MSNTATAERPEQQEWRQAIPASGDRGTWTDQQANLIEAMGLVHTDRDGVRTLAPRPVVEAFLYTCRRTGLDPLARQVYCIARWDGASQQLKWTTQTSIDGFRVIAERHGQYAGQGDVEWLTEQNEWVPVFLPGRMGDHPLAARATVYRHDFLHPLRAVAEWTAYAQTKANGDLVQMWQRMGPGQLAKCAEALALRKGFPQDLSGLYTADEMGQAESEAGVAAPPRQLQTEQAAQASATQQQTVSTPGGVDSEARDDWWRQITEVKHKGKRGSGDGGARDLFGRMYEAGVLGWPVEDGDPLTLGDALMQVSAKLPEERPAEEPADPDSDPSYEADDDGSAEDTPMVFAAPAPAPAAQQVSEPLPPAPAGPAAPVVVDEAEPEVAPWTPAGEQPEEWVQPTADDDTPPF